ncbi:MAG: hypothetical protein ACRDSP_17810 [Pseudonocardiaceae bacterium]
MIAQEIVDDLQAALNEFTAVAEALEAAEPPGARAQGWGFSGHCASLTACPEKAQ